MIDFRDDIVYPYEFAGCTVYRDKRICNTCGQEVGDGLIPMAIHWNNCIDKNKTLTALKNLREEKGEALTVDDIDKIFPQPQNETEE